MTSQQLAAAPLLRWDRSLGTSRQAMQIDIALLYTMLFPLIYTLFGENGSGEEETARPVANI